MFLKNFLLPTTVMTASTLRASISFRNNRRSGGISQIWSHIIDGVKAQPFGSSPATGNGTQKNQL